MPEFSSFSSSSPSPLTLEELESQNQDHHDQQDPTSSSALMSFQQSQAAHPYVDNGAALAAELIRLSIQEREEILHDLHGVAPTVPETTESIQTALEQLHTHLNEFYANSNNTNSPASVYQMALQSDNSSQYVLNPSFGLLFLRSELFHIPAAAHKLVRFLQTKLQLFGPSKLCHTITLEDLGSDGLAALESGRFQLLPSRDRAGRAVFCFPAQLAIHNIPIDAELRQLYYIVMSALEDPETQINGVVMMPWGLPRDSPWRAWKVNSLMSTMPYQVKGWHTILAENVAPWLSWLTSILDQKSRMRMRMHNGTHQEIMYSLMTFGIPTSYIPVQADGSVDRSHHHRWIQARRDLEARRHGIRPPAAPTNNTIYMDDDDNCEEGGEIGRVNTATTDMFSNIRSSEIFLPTSKDILFGRGKPFQQHAGNVRLSLMLESMQERYESLPRHEKTTLAQDIVRAFQANGSRFLRRGSNDLDGILWEEVKDSEAREKVSQLFRSMRQGKHNHQEHSHSSGHAGATTTSSSSGTSNALPPTVLSTQSKKRGRIPS